MQEPSLQPLTRESLQELLTALERSGGDFIRFGELGHLARQARTPEELARLSLPMPASELLRHAENLGRLQTLWSAFGGYLSRWGLGFDAALALLRRLAGTKLGQDRFGGATEDELRVLEAFGPRIEKALSPFRTAAMREIVADLEAKRDQPAGIGDHDPEAREWLRANGQEAPLASNRFDAEDALAFVEALYAAGAERVVVPGDSIRDDEHELSLGGPYADALKVQLPTDRDRRYALFAIANREAEEEGFDPQPDVGQDVLFLWWD